MIQRLQLVRFFVQFHDRQFIKKFCEWIVEYLDDRRIVQFSGWLDDSETEAIAHNGKRMRHFGKFIEHEQMNIQKTIFIFPNRIYVDMVIDKF